MQSVLTGRETNFSYAELYTAAQGDSAGIRNGNLNRSFSFFESREVEEDALGDELDALPPEVNAEW